MVWYETWYLACAVFSFNPGPPPDLHNYKGNNQLMKSIKLAALTMLLAVAALPAVAQNSGIELLKKMEGQFQGLKSVSGSFTQTREDPVYKTKKNSPARFWILKPNYFRAEYTDAEGQAPSVQLISGQMFYNYVPQLKQVNTYKFRGESNVRDLNYLLLGFGAKADEITKVYSVKPEGDHGVRLTPRNPQEASFQYIVMQVDPQSLYPTSFTMKQSDGANLSVRMNTSGLQINPAMSPNDFKPNFPKDAHTVSMQ